MRIPLYGGLALVLALLASPARARANVLILVADDVGVDVLASYGLGSDLPQTPNLDSLAADGVQFRNAWSNPMCSTTRATILTGRYSFRHGLGHLVTNSWALPLEEVILPEVLDQQGTGYAHGAFGKWHLGNPSVGGESAPNVAGFSYYAGSLGNLTDYYYWSRVVNGTAAHTTEYATTQTARDALDWIDVAPEPWVCYVAFNAAHTPLHVPPTGTFSVRLEGVGSPLENPRPYYKAMVEAMDHEIGNLLAGLGSRLANTVVLFVGDNGSPMEVTVPPFLPSHGKTTAYQGGVQVPLIVTGPVVQQKGSVCDALVSTTDLFSTALEIAGAQPPPGRTIDGISLLPYLADPSFPSIRTVGFTELFFPNGPPPHKFLRRAVRDDRYKLILDAWSGVERVPGYLPPDELLFDLWLDPFERTNLLRGTPSPAQRRAYLRLSEEMEHILED